MEPAFRVRERIRVRRSAPVPSRGHDGLPLPLADLQVLVMGGATPQFVRRWMGELSRLLGQRGRPIFSITGRRCRITWGRASGWRSGVESAYHPRAWVERELVPHLELLRVIEGGAPGMPGQDLYVVRKAG